MTDDARKPVAAEKPEPDCQRFRSGDRVRLEHDPREWGVVTVYAAYRGTGCWRVSVGPNLSIMGGVDCDEGAVELVERAVYPSDVPVAAAEVLEHKITDEHKNLIAEADRILADPKANPKDLRFLVWHLRAALTPPENTKT